VRLEVKAASSHELALQEHMQRYRQIPCQQTIRDGCSYNPVVAQFPEFDPFQAQATAPSGPVGCEKIEAQGLGGPPEVGQGVTESFPERFLFQHNASEADASMSSIAQAVAQRMSADPSIDCIGVTGQSAGGESPALGQLRAAAIKRLLVHAGVPPEKMMTISASVAVTTSGNEVPAAKPEDQRVTITVILRSTPTQ
jgi:outer membrane protein OmpA-like peptidoglycan-associated protein